MKKWFGLRSRKLRCSEQMLSNAVRAVGSMVKDVKDWVKNIDELCIAFIDENELYPAFSD